MTAMRDVQRHPLTRRVAHWAMALAVIVMIGSGWRIYNWEPIFPFSFPGWATLGGDPDLSQAIHDERGLSSALLWHFAGMWLLVASLLTFALQGLLSGHFRRDWLPVRPAEVAHDLVAALTFKLDHRLGVYNAVQKVLYLLVLLGLFVMVLTGLAIWKPVQFQALTWLCGGFQGARIIHFLAMAGIALFLAVHVALVALVPKTLVAMVTGEASEPSRTEQTT